MQSQRNRRTTLRGVLFGILLFTGTAHAKSFHLGNSLTNDTLPQRLRADYSIFCNKSLDDIMSNPAGYCQQGSQEWPDALTNRDYELIVVQTHLGDTVAGTTAHFATLQALQPSAQFIYHNGWTEPTSLLTDHADPDSVYSPVFARKVIAGLPAAIPVTRVMDALVYIANDPTSPYEGISALYRSGAHLIRGDGRYLAHQILRRTMGMDPIDIWEGGGTDPVHHRDYLDRLLNAGDYDWDGDADGADFLIWQREYIPGSTLSRVVPEPSAAVPLLVGITNVLMGGRRRVTMRTRA